MDERELLKQDAVGASCMALMEGTAVRVTDNKRVSASYVTRQQGPFYCSECYSNVIIRKCKEKRDHFAHQARQSPILRNSESALHIKCKDDILACLNAAFPEGKWEKERAVEANKEKGLAKVVPDISGRISEKAVVIEVQKSVISIDKIIHRTKEYTKRKAHILWIIPLRDELGNDPFRPRLYEKFLHQMYFDRVYYWIDGCQSTLIPVHFSPAYRWIEGRDWYDSDGDQQSGGGYWKRYRTVREPCFGSKVDICRDIICEMVEEWKPKNELLTVPSRRIARDSRAPWWNDTTKVPKGPTSDEAEDTYFDFDDYKVANSRNSSLSV
ncbi:competence protein CoiA family protein [Spirosoma rhododendri]|uniref:Uncharacterized protein n=1 Tax=Spirosoma rhododendri TaxID=2728024 RepID=A0A7L5DVJ8_9BACT|nr:competence protein CoiA family protein [Spirosoma rhododendri]QJD81622.1 hypothetical protein HH216_25070 [Spirosoma rhododendri]